MFNGEKLDTFILTLKKKARCSLLSFISNIVMNSWLISELRRRNTKYMDWEGRNEIIIVESLEFTSVQA